MPQSTPCSLHALVACIIYEVLLIHGFLLHVQLQISMALHLFSWVGLKSLAPGGVIVAC